MPGTVGAALQNGRPVAAGGCRRVRRGRLVVSHDAGGRRSERCCASTGLATLAEALPRRRPFVLDVRQHVPCATKSRSISPSRHDLAIAFRSLDSHLRRQEGSRALAAPPRAAALAALRAHAAARPHSRMGTAGPRRRDRGATCASRRPARFASSSSRLSLRASIATATACSTSPLRLSRAGGRLGDGTLRRHRFRARRRWRRPAARTRRDPRGTALVAAHSRRSRRSTPIDRRSRDGQTASLSVRLASEPSPSTATSDGQGFGLRRQRRARRSAAAPAGPPPTSSPCPPRATPANRCSASLATPA